MTLKHSYIGASSMKRGMKCPPSVFRSRGVPSRSSPAAEEGTLHHEYLEKCLLGTLKLEDIPPGEGRDAVQIAVEYVIDVMADEKVKPEHTFIEQRLACPEIHPDLFGTGDVILYSEETRTLHVIDYKHGKGIPVDVIDEDGPNVQLMYYGVGATHLPALEGVHIERIVLTIVQPRCAHSDGPIRSVVVSPKDLLLFARKLAVYATYGQNEHGSLNPGEWCRFCPVAPSCEALASKANEVAAGTFTNHLTDPERLAAALEKAPAIEAYLKAIREAAYTYVEQGGVLPGWKRVQKRATRRWRDEVETVEILKAGGLEEKEIFDLKLRSPAQIEKHLGKLGRSAIKDLTVSESSGFTLVPESDPRPSVKPDVEAYFSVLTDD
jgi:hypothetical protein